MKILHITTDDFGGAGKCCLRIHQALLDVGVDSIVLTIRNTQHVSGEYSYGVIKDFLSKAISKILDLLGVRMIDRSKIRYLSKKYHTVYSLPISYIDISKSEWVEWADLIHLHWVNNFLDYPSFFKKVKKPIVWTLHDENFFYGIAHHHKSVLIDNPLEKKYRLVKYETIRCIEKLTIVFLSQQMYQTFGNERIIERRRRTVINNSVNTQVFRPQDRIVVRKKNNLDCQINIIVFIAVDITDSNKGLDILSDVLYSIDKKAVILAIGGNPNGKKWKNVNSVGFVKDSEKMCELISCANYMVMPSFQEAFSQSPIEAMACGLPVTAFPVSGATELINEGNGVVCDDFTPDALRCGLEKMMNSQYDPQKIRQDMIDRFSPEIMAQKYINTYRELMCSSAS